MEDKVEMVSGAESLNDLYDLRMAYNAALFNVWAACGNAYSVHKSKRHEDGKECFGGDYFIVCAMLPAGQITNHYQIEHWDLFKVQVSDKARFRFDGHTSRDVIERLLDISK